MKLQQKVLNFSSGPLSLLPLIGLKKPANNVKRDEGLSVFTVVRNEPWIEPCLNSIKNIADELVIVDSSDKPITSLAEKLKKEGVNVRYVHTKPSFVDQVRQAFELCSKRWILQWDADLVGYESVKNIKKIIPTLDKRKYYAISFNLANLDYDLSSTAGALHREPYLINYSEDLLDKKTTYKIINAQIHKFLGQIPSRVPFRPIPPWYKRIILDDVFALHLRTVKSRKRALEKPFQLIWNTMSSPEFRDKYNNNYNQFIKEARNSKATEFGEQFVKYIWNITSAGFKKKYGSYEKFLKHANKTCFEDIYAEYVEDTLSPFDVRRFGYPKILRKWVKDKLGMEIQDTEEFKKRLHNYLDNF